eukprot:scaffold142453_cov22-Tisochrysis_lutea.AAC.1
MPAGKTSRCVSAGVSIVRARTMLGGTYKCAPECIPRCQLTLSISRERVSSLAFNHTGDWIAVYAVPVPAGVPADINGFFPKKFQNNAAFKWMQQCDSILVWQIMGLKQSFYSPWDFSLFSSLCSLLIVPVHLFLFVLREKLSKKPLPPFYFACACCAVGCAKLGQLLVWEWRSDSYVLKQQGHYHDISTTAFSPDGALVATGSDDRK